MPGTLYVVGTPIGNLSDITSRAVEALRISDMVACEDTRHTAKLMNHLGIQKTLFRYDEHTHEPATRKILDRLHHGESVSLVTDAGTPGVSDPGSRLVREVVKKGYPVVPIPGPSAVIAALSATGLGAGGFVFLGFLPRRPGRAKRMLQQSVGLGKTIVLFESPFRVISTLMLLQNLMPMTTVVMAREMTKIHEEFLWGNPQSLRASLEGKEIKGEVVLLIEPCDPSTEKNETE